MWLVSALQGSGILQTIDPKVITKIYQLVNDGVCNPKDIQRELQHYVIHDLFKDRTSPDFSNRRYFPTQRDVRNHYYLAVAKRKLAKADQENVNLLVEEWKKASASDGNIYFRPYLAGGSGSRNTTNISVPSSQSHAQTLLFVHQMAWQRRLLERYGHDICFLDATYKTSKYALPLFFLCVKANVGYEVVATFILQNETQADIGEALQILKKWNPVWNPQFFMTDKSDAEIQAIETCFAGTVHQLLLLQNIV